MNMKREMVLEKSQQGIYKLGWLWISKGQKHSCN